MSAQEFSYALALATVLGDILAVILLVLLFTNHPLRRSLSRLSLHAMWLIAISGTVTSLIYSDFFHYAACNLCWYQRTMLYPQVIILGLAVRMRDKRVAHSIAWLSGIGAVLAFYNHGLQMGWFAERGICGTGPTAISCAKIYVLQFGFVTIPWMAFTGFVLSFLLALHMESTEAN